MSWIVERHSNVVMHCFDVGRPMSFRSRKLHGKGGSRIWDLRARWIIHESSNSAIPGGIPIPIRNRKRCGPVQSTCRERLEKTSIRFHSTARKIFDVRTKPQQPTRCEGQDECLDLHELKLHFPFVLAVAKDGVIWLFCIEKSITRDLRTVGISVWIPRIREREGEKKVLYLT